MNEVDRTIHKPADSRWTDEQWAAIAAGGRHVLVSAAAGSGKTAVLVERILSRIADESQPIDVDALLVATFTKAAAAEMKARIRSALEDALERRPDSRHLRRQLALLPRAMITTLHAFCLEIVRQHAALIGLDPDFRIAGETEAELLKMDVLDELLEERYAAESGGRGDGNGRENGGGGRNEPGPLTRLVERFGDERGDGPLHRLVLELYDFSRSHPWPEHWLRECASRFAAAGADDLATTPWADELKEEALLTLDGAIGTLAAARELALRPDGPQPYAQTLADDLDMLRTLRDTVTAAPWARWPEAFAAVSFGRLKSCRGEGIDPALQERVKRMRDEAKQAVTRLAEEWMTRDPETYAAELRELAPDMAALAELVIAFGERYTRAKRDRGMLDFSDLEHEALRILRAPESTPERPVPSAVALAYRERFAEILLDEYQDTNEVQEAIVSLIARENPGNVFMVGDVKQSIYRFRLAEPGLFLHKFRTFGVWSREDGLRAAAGADGVRIDLARNFRSRRPVLDAVNHVFRLIMREPVGELNYDRSAELVYGEGYPESETPFGGGATGDRRDPAAELILIRRDAPADETAAEEELEAVQLEARCIAAEIRRMTGVGDDGLPRFAVWDGSRKLHRPLMFRDIVILLRSTAELAPVVLDELKAAGIPAYADLATGYFAATEVDTMMSLLQIIDNPDQDIPLAGVLRSPIVGLSAEQLAQIRLHDRRASFWRAVRKAAESERTNPELKRRLADFLARLESWRSFARREPIGDLILKLYRETEYYNFVGGLPGGAQRQANLRALVDRARQFERSGGSRGLYRFLRFLGRMRETGADLGAARALGEQEDVVRIMSIHKSKGLEFPVVFVAGLGRAFNRQDLNGLFLFHKRLGFGPKMVEPDTRQAYPTLPHLAIRRRLAAEMVAEEMRVLYVAMTRAKEKLVMVGTSRNGEQDLARWREALDRGDGRLPDAAIAAAGRYLDWIGPAVLAGERSEASPIALRSVPANAYAVRESPAAAERQDEDALWRALERLEPAPVEESEAGRRAYEALSWTYPRAAATRLAAKTSVTAMKRMRDEAAEADRLAAAEADAEMAEAEEARAQPDEPDGGAAPEGSFRLRRPRFLSARRLTPAERGIAYHLVMQHLPLQETVREEDVERLIRRLVDARMLNDEQGRAIEAAKVAAFCASELYARMRSARRLWREMPFSFGLPAAEVYAAVPHGREVEGDTVLVQGVIDCLFEEDDGLVLIDYKTDADKGRSWPEAAEAHRFQIRTYGEAIARILRRPVKEGYVYFLEGGVAVRLV